MGSQVARLVKNPPAMQETPIQFLGQEVPLEKGQDRLPTPVFLGFLGGSDGKESAYNVEDLGLIPGWEDPLEEDMATHSSILCAHFSSTYIGQKIGEMFLSRVTWKWSLRYGYG